MIPNNNLSVLPWYTSIEQQNARKWWIYNRIYPLFTPAGFLLPFQVMRQNPGEYAPIGSAFEPTNEYDRSAIELYDDLTYQIVSSSNHSSVWEFYLSSYDSPKKIYFNNLPAGVQSHEIITNVLFLDENDNVIEHYNLLSGQFGVSYNGGLDVPQNAERLIIQAKADDYAGEASVFEAEIVPVNIPITEFKIYTKDGILVDDYSNVIIPQITIKNKQDIDVIVYVGNVPFAQSFANGQYYAKMSDGTNTWYSEIFTVVNDIEPYLKIVWWDNEDFVMDAGTIVYQLPGGVQYQNVLYLQADIAKPEYPFEEEGETRDGYFFPIKQISEKRYRFSFLASEYLLDVMRFIRMADYAKIEKNGQTYNLDSFLITPEWEDNGDVAAVSAEFDTATVAKKIGRAFIPSGI